MPVTRLGRALILTAGCDASPRPSEPLTVRAIVEGQAGSRDKVEHRDGAFVVDRVLPEAVGGYPVNYGFIPCTRAPDGDPLDVLVPGPPQLTGAALRVRVVGLMRMVDEKGDDPKLLAVEPNGQEWSAGLRREVATFFDRYKDDQPGAHARVLGWADADEARRVLESFSKSSTGCRPGGS